MGSTHPAQDPDPEVFESEEQALETESRVLDLREQVSEQRDRAADKSTEDRLKGLFAAVAGHTDVRIYIKRIATTPPGLDVGHLATVEMIEIEEAEGLEPYIKRNFGGGRYKVEFRRGGGTSYQGCVTIPIAGRSIFPDQAAPPKSSLDSLEELAKVKGLFAGENDTVVPVVQALVAQNTALLEQSKDSQGGGDIALILEQMREDRKAAAKRFDQMLSTGAALLPAIIPIVEKLLRGRGTDPTASLMEHTLPKIIESFSGLQNRMTTSLMERMFDGLSKDPSADQGFLGKAREILSLVQSAGPSLQGLLQPAAAPAGVQTPAQTPQVPPGSMPVQIPGPAPEPAPAAAPPVPDEAPAPEVPTPDHAAITRARVQTFLQALQVELQAGTDPRGAALSLGDLFLLMPKSVIDLALQFTGPDCLPAIFEEIQKYSGEESLSALAPLVNEQSGEWISEVIIALLEANFEAEEESPPPATPMTPDDAKEMAAKISAGKVIPLPGFGDSSGEAPQEPALP